MGSEINTDLFSNITSTKTKHVKLYKRQYSLQGYRIELHYNVQVLAARVHPDIHVPVLINRQEKTALMSPYITYPPDVAQKEAWISMS